MRSILKIPSRFRTGQQVIICKGDHAAVAGPSGGPVRWNQAIIARMSWGGSGTCTPGKVTFFSPAWLIFQMKLACQVAVEWPSNRLIEPFFNQRLPDGRIRCTHQSGRFRTRRQVPRDGRGDTVDQSRDGHTGLLNGVSSVRSCTVHDYPPFQAGKSNVHALARTRRTAPGHWAAPGKHCDGVGAAHTGKTASSRGRWLSRRAPLASTTTMSSIRAPHRPGRYIPGSMLNAMPSSSTRSLPATM